MGNLHMRLNRSIGQDASCKRYDEKDDLCGYFEWKTENGQDRLCTVCFSNPPSYEYIVKESGESFKTHTRIVSKLMRSIYQVRE